MTTNDEESTCRIYEVDGEPIRVHAERPMNAADQEALAEVVRAAKRKMAADEAEMTPEQRADRDAKQARSAALIREMNERARS